MANVAFVLIWLLSRKKARALISLVGIVVCYKLIITVFAFNYTGTNDMVSGPGRLKVMHWNIHGMGLYDKKNRSKKNDRDVIMDKIKEENPDILVMPEYYMYRDSSSKSNEQKISQSCGFKEYHFGVDNTLGIDVVLGTIVFSKYPLLDYTVYHLGDWIIMQQADVQIDGRMIRMFFLHLFSFNINDYDRAYLHQVKEQTPGISEIKHSRTFIWKFNRAFAIRASEADSVAAIVKKSPYPVFISGDFNDLPASYTYTTVRGGLNDAFLDKGRGLGRTYNQLLFTLRIDDMFYDPAALQVIGYKCPTIYASDHNPVIANFRVLK
jgi:endonuclease/exonuclease/phosphatase family metal-dependent hydrolase